MFRLLLPSLVTLMVVAQLQAQAQPPPSSSDAADVSEEPETAEPAPPAATNDEDSLPPPLRLLPLPLSVHASSGVRTIIAPGTLTIHTPALAKVGELVQHVPTAVSHQSQTVVHQRERVVTPILAPAVRTITAHLLHAYHAPPSVLVTPPHHLLLASSP